MAPARNVLCLVAAMALVVLTLAENKIPSGWDTCKASDPNMDKCLKSAVQKAMRDLGKGNAALGMAALDPLRVDKFHLNRGGNGPLNIDMTFLEPEMSGTNQGKLESVKMDLAKGRLAMDFRVPSITLVGKYMVRGRVLVIPINGEGRANIKMDNVHLKLNIQGHKQKQGKKEFFKVDAVEFDVVPQQTSFKFINPAHLQQAELLSRVVTENNKSIMQELRPTISAAFGEKFKSYVAPVFDIPMDDLFPH